MALKKNKLLLSLRNHCFSFILTFIRLHLLTGHNRSMMHIPALWNFQQTATRRILQWMLPVTIWRLSQNREENRLPANTKPIGKSNRTLSEHDENKLKTIHQLSHIALYFMTRLCKENKYLATNSNSDKRKIIDKEMQHEMQHEMQNS